MISSVNVVQLYEIRKLVSFDGEVDWVGTHDLVSDSIGMSVLSLAN
jgi:hypothetical protein